MKSELNWRTVRAYELARVRRLQAADVVDGTVCRWTSVAGNGTSYRYVALYVAERWWITGVADFYGKRRFTTYEFVTQVLSQGTEIAVVTEWEPIR